MYCKVVSFETKQLKDLAQRSLRDNCLTPYSYGAIRIVKCLQ